MADATKLSSADASSCYVHLVKAANNLHAAMMVANRTEDDEFAVAALRRLNENLEAAKADWRERYPEVIAPPTPLPPAA